MKNMEIDDQEFLKEILQEFQEEAFQRLTKIENLLISFSPEKKDIATEVKRELHTLKGSSGMLNLETFSTLSHKLEELFKQSEEKGSFPKNLLSFFLEGISLMKKYLQDFSLEKKLLEFIISVEKYKINESEEAEEEEISPPQDVELNKYGESKYITIDVEKIDNFLNFIEEFIFREEEIITQKGTIIQINKMAKKLLKKEKYTPLREEIEKAFHFFRDYVNNSKIYIEELKNHMHILRTQPLSSIFDALPAQVFKISQTLGKKVEFYIKGREIELDRRIISQIGEPLIHMIRNAIDHGIENPEERKLKGKTETGKIVLSARYEGDNIFIELEDDGKGIDIEKIKEKALSRKLVSKEELNSMSEQGIINLIFTPGFSTKADVTMLSGRGIGMDIVKNKILELGGEIFIDSKRDKYTKITLRLPATLGIGRILFLRLKDFTFGVFSFHVKNIFKKGTYKEIYIGKERFLKIESLLVPIIDLSEVFTKEGIESYYIQFLINAQNFILGVDEIIDEREVVIRPFSEYLRKKTKVFNSFAMLQEGRIVPLLEVQTIFNYRTIYRKKIVEEEVKESKEFSYKVLLVEDAPVTRKMESMVLKDEGLSVYEASNGKEALEIYKKNPEISIIITDLEMPVMDGAEFIKNIREEDRKIPIVVVTTLSEKQIKREVLELSNLIIPKREFTREDFIKKIKDLISKRNENNRRD